MQRVFFYIIAVISTALAIKYHYGSSDILLLVISTVLSFFFFQKMGKIKDNILELFLIVYILLAVHVVALFELSSTGFFKDYISFKEYQALALWGNRLYFVLFSSLFIYRRIKYKKTEEKAPTNIKRDLDKPFKLITFFTYFLAIVSVFLGSSDLMGEVKIVLPFHLNGLIDEFRSNVYPFIFAIYVFDCLKKKKPIRHDNVVLFLVYVLAEIIVKSSKGAFLFSFIPVLTLLAFMGYYSGKTIVRYVFPLIIAFLILYPIIETARSEGSVSFSSLQEASKTERSNQGEDHSSPYIRAFLTGVYYTKLVDIVSDDQFSFDLRRVPLLISMDFGGVSYMTNIIDGVPEGAKQSSGITGLCDALVWGGHPLCYIVLALLVLLCYWGDHKGYMQNTPLYRVILFYIIYRLVLGRTISIFSDTFFFAMMGTTVIKIIVAKFYYRKYY